MKIFFVSSEVVPFSKTGGLADVSGALPKALKSLGHDVRVFSPRYKGVDKKKFHLKKTTDKVLEGRLPGCDAVFYFFDDEKYFGSRDELYQVKGRDYEDNLERFAAFCKGALEFLKEIRWQPDVIHCNDWQSALIIAYLKVLHKDDPFFKNIAAVYSIHNMAYLGLFNKEKLLHAGLGWDQFTPDKLEFWDNISLAKAGLVYADVINTVSETYAREIQASEFGCGLDGLLRSRSQDVYGIVNGIDYDAWNPLIDKNIPFQYNADNLDLKLRDKFELQKANRLPEDEDIPVIGMTTRLADQKGLDILSGAMEAVMKTKCQLVILGTGDPKYHQFLAEQKKKYASQIGLNLGFDAALAQLIYAGSDMFLMPSRYEPCGLGQLISFKYGTIPIVRKTGGLADTVTDKEGFVFEGYTSKALADAILRAVEAFKNKSSWQALQKKVMALDYSWENSAQKYVALYGKALAKVR